MRKAIVDILCLVVNSNPYNLYWTGLGTRLPLIKRLAIQVRVGLFLLVPAWLATACYEGERLREAKEGETRMEGEGSLDGPFHSYRPLRGPQGETHVVRFPPLVFGETYHADFALALPAEASGDEAEWRVKGSCGCLTPRISGVSDAGELLIVELKFEIIDQEHLHDKYLMVSSLNGRQLSRIELHAEVLTPLLFEQEYIDLSTVSLDSKHVDVRFMMNPRSFKILEAFSAKGLFEVVDSDVQKRGATYEIRPARDQTDPKITDEFRLRVDVQGRIIERSLPVRFLDVTFAYSEPSMLRVGRVKLGESRNLEIRLRKADGVIETLLDDGGFNVELIESHPNTSLYSIGFSAGEERGMFNRSLRFELTKEGVERRETLEIPVLALVR